MRVYKKRSWISLPLAQRLLEVNEEVLRNLIKDGVIGFRQVPGSTPKVFREDIVRVAQASTRPAVRPPAKLQEA
jgi:hypothetical protein